jgi:acyl-CoA synthetase (AMP-forming)/AMP-acid ligase II
MITKSRQSNFDGRWKLPLLPDYIMRWADITPDNDCIVFADTGRTYSYREFDALTDLYAMRLKKMGIGKGDIVVTQLLGVPQFYLMVYGCLKAGAIISPIDVKQQGHEVVRDLDKIRAKAFFCYSKTPIRDFTEVAETVRDKCSYVKHLVQWIPAGAPGDLVRGAESFEELFGDTALEQLKQDTALAGALLSDYEKLQPRDPALIIFTTGTTGEPKPALMSHLSIMTNNEVFSRGVGLYGSDFRFLNIMPTSHVAGTAQGPMTAWYRGGAIITLSMFDPVKSLEAVAKYRANFYGGVPTMFRMIWALPNYRDYDISNLRYALYGGSAVDTAFLREMAKMAPTFGTALGMTETSGYFTCTPRGISVEEMAGQVGQFYPELAKVTIRKPMNDDGTAGEELPEGEPGDICVQGDVVFLGYYDNPEATAKTVTKEGVLYTGDMGLLKDFGTYKGLVFSGRRKFVIKPKGYLVFPDEVTDFLTKHPKINQAQVVGVPHTIFVDGVFAFVQPKPGESLTAEEVFEYCKGVASYKRPVHVEFWPVDRQFPMNKTGKVNSLELIDIATKVVGELRRKGMWDAGS